MNKKTILIGLMVCLMLTVSACGKKSGASTGGAPTTPFIGGTQGVTMEFEKDSPPPEVTDDATFAFNIIVKLKNEGETKVEMQNIKLKVEGFDPADFGVNDFNELRNIEPDSELESKKRDAEGNIIDGTTTFATFPGNSQFFEPTRFMGNTEFPIRAKACYLYETQSNTKLCGLRDMINIRDNAICRPTESKTVYSSSGPVQVQGFRQSVVGRDKISFSFDIVLSNSVDIFWSRDENTPSQGFDLACPEDPRTRREVENNVKVEITEVPVDPLFSNLKCGGLDNLNVGVVKLVNGRRTITCTVELVPDRNDFEKVVGINLKYNVLDSEDTRILVKHLADAP